MRSSAHNFVCITRTHFKLASSLKCRDVMRDEVTLEQSKQKDPGFCFFLCACVLEKWAPLPRSVGALWSTLFFYLFSVAVNLQCQHMQSFPDCLADKFEFAFVTSSMCWWIEFISFCWKYLLHVHSNMKCACLCPWLYQTNVCGWMTNNN